MILNDFTYQFNAVIPLQHSLGMLSVELRLGAEMMLTGGAVEVW